MVNGKYKKEFISRVFSHKAINWPKEMKMLNKLIEQYDSDAFWAGLIPPFALPSLAWFLTQDGEKFLRQEWAKFNFTPDEIKRFEIEENLEPEPPNPIINNKGRRIKSIKDFLNIK